MTLTITDIISKINKSKTFVEVFSDLSNWLAEYKKYAKQIHPDICHEAGAKDALTKLNEYKEELEKGKSHMDDAGTIVYRVNSTGITGNKLILEHSLNHFNTLLSYKEKMDKDFQRYIPVSAKLTSIPNQANVAKLDFNLNLRCIPLSALGTLPQGHVNWILSRMLEYIAYINKKGFVHCGINPDSVYVEPINHGINVISYYHMTKIGSKMGTASGKYLYMYPDHVKTKKIATPDIDIELCKRTAIYLLGDKSGIGTSLRKTHSLAFLDFINKRHTDPVEAFIDYRKMLDKNFEKKFLPLIV